MIKTGQIAFPALAAILVIAGAATLFAHTGATGIVKERMGYMADMGSAMKGIKANIEADTVPANEALLLAATMLSNHSGENLNRLFPEGSDHKPTRALPAVWTDKADFDAISNQLHENSLALAISATRFLEMDDSPTLKHLDSDGKARVATLSKQPVRDLFKAIAGTCRSCHQRYRGDK
jgi:cytochrome c556